MPEDKRKSRIRYGAVFAILLLLYAAAVSFLVRMRLPAMMDATRIAEHIELYMQGPVPEPSAEVQRLLYSSDGAVVTTSILPSFGRNRLHLAAEAALLPPTEEELAAGLVSYIPEGTELIGISKRADYIYIDLSDEMLGADDRAWEEIRESIALTIDFREMRFMVEGDLLEE